MSASTIRIGLVYPELLCTYGDRGNAVVLVNRLQWRGIDAELVECAAGEPLPDSLDVYCIGGGEDTPQALASDGLRASATALQRARDHGAAILAVCAGFQLIGGTYTDADGTTLDGLGLIDATTHAQAPRLINEVLVEAEASLGLTGSDALITGFENHGGRTTLGPGVTPMGHVVVGHGNGVPTAAGTTVDGALGEHLIGTYLHGPVLARNPALADVILGWVVGELPVLASPLEGQLHDERVADARKTGLAAWRRDQHLARG
jgi:CobQ-like glutamine amidotransferase family enzyme